METVPISTSVTAREQMKKLVGWRICLSTAKLTMTKRLPKVVMTMQTAMETAMRTVRSMPNGAGQQEGPQSWMVTPSPSSGLRLALGHSGELSRESFQGPGTQSGGWRLLVRVVVRREELLVTRAVAEAVVVSRKLRHIS